jgi:hypothetical protein
MANEDEKNANESDTRGTTPASKVKQKPNDPAKKEEQSKLTTKAQVNDPEKTDSPLKKQLRTSAAKGSISLLNQNENKLRYGNSVFLLNTI